MNYLAFHETKVRGTFGFPIEFHYVSSAHPRYQMPMHWHMEYELILITQGSFSLTLDSRTLELSKGDIVLVPDGIIHGGMPHNCTYECIVFDLNKFLQGNSECHAKIEEIVANSQLQYLFRENDRVNDGSDNNVYKIAIAMFHSMEKEKVGYEFITTGLLWQLTGTILEQHLFAQNSQTELKNAKRVRRMKQALSRIRKDYGTMLTLEDLASDAGMAPRYFCRVFAQTTGRTPIDYLNYYRVECAAERLLVTDESVTEIALSCGFNDSSYFAKTFKKYKGVSAQEFRNRF